MNDGGGATSECWNCRTLPDHASDEFCSRCGESLKPNSEQARLTHSHIQFLLKEVERWESAPPRWRRDLQARYKSRLQFLEPICASAGEVTIAITSDTMRLAGVGTTGSRTLAANGIATAIKLTSTEWIISGSGLS